MAQHFYEDRRRGRKMAGRSFLCNAAEETREAASKTEWKEGTDSHEVVCAVAHDHLHPHTHQCEHTHNTHNK